NRGGDTPLHAQIVRQFHTALTEGALHSGDVIPPEPQLAATLGVARATLRLALRRLAVDGLIIRRRGWGTRVSTADSSGHAAAVAGTHAAGHLGATDLLADVAVLREQVARLSGELVRLRAEMSENLDALVRATDRREFTVARVEK